MWVEFVVGSLYCFEKFFPGSPVFSFVKKLTFPSPIRPGMVPVDEEPLCGQATSKSLFIIYIFYTMKENFLLTNKN